MTLFAFNEGAVYERSHTNKSPWSWYAWNLIVNTGAIRHHIRKYKDFLLLLE